MGSESSEVVVRDEAMSRGCLSSDVDDHHGSWPGCRAEGHRMAAARAADVRNMRLGSTMGRSSTRLGYYAVRGDGGRNTRTRKRKLRYSVLSAMSIDVNKW